MLLIDTNRLHYTSSVTNKYVLMDFRANEANRNRNLFDFSVKFMVSHKTFAVLKFIWKSLIALELSKIKKTVFLGSSMNAQTVF